jgi:hypothetical protein
MTKRCDTPCASSAAISGTDESSAATHTKGNTDMTTKEQRHRDEVRHMCASLDEETAADMASLTAEYLAARAGLRSALHHLSRLDGLILDEGGYNELRMELRSMLDGLRSDEIALLELCGAMSTPSEVQNRHEVDQAVAWGVEQIVQDAFPEMSAPQQPTAAPQQVQP